MNEAALLAGLGSSAFAFALVLARTSVAIMLVPGLGEAEPPAIVRAGLSLALTLLLLPAVVPLVPSVPLAGVDAARMIVSEVVAGGMLGWLARLPSLALSMTGAVVSYMLGLSSVVQTDPALGGQAAALSRLFGLAAPALVLSSGLYALPLTALAGSYHLLPPGELAPAGALAESVTGAVVASFGLAVRLSAPFIMASVLWQSGLGVLTRLAPQLQLTNVSAPGQILGGLLLLGVLAAGILGEWSSAMQEAWRALPGS